MSAGPVCSIDTTEMSKDLEYVRVVFLTQEKSEISIQLPIAQLDAAAELLFATLALVTNTRIANQMPMLPRQKVPQPLPPLTAMAAIQLSKDVLQRDTVVLHFVAASGAQFDFALSKDAAAGIARKILSDLENLFRPQQ